MITLHDTEGREYTLPDAINMINDRITNLENQVVFYRTTLDLLIDNHNLLKKDLKTLGKLVFRGGR